MTEFAGGQAAKRRWAVRGGHYLARLLRNPRLSVYGWKVETEAALTLVYRTQDQVEVLRARWRRTPAR